MGKKRKPGKPFSPGNEVGNKTVLRVEETGTKVIHWKYLVLSSCCGCEQVIGHDALRRIESTGKGTLCAACVAKLLAAMGKKKSRRKSRSSKHVEGSPEWAHSMWR